MDIGAIEPQVLVDEVDDDFACGPEDAFEFINGRGGQIDGWAAWSSPSLRPTPGLFVAVKCGPFHSSIAVSSSAGLDRARLRSVDRRPEREFWDPNGRCTQDSTSSVVRSLPDEVDSA